MARRKHAVTERIEEAHDLLTRHGWEITPENLRKNIKISWEDWPPEQALNEARDARIASYLRRLSIVDAEVRPGGRPRKAFWDSLTAELREDLKVKQQSNDYDRKWIRAEKAVIAYLEEKERELGYEVYPGLFHADIDRIYRMNGVAPPGGNG